MIRQSNLTFYKIWNNQNPSETNQNPERIQQEPSWNPPANNQNAQANHQESTWIAGFNAWWILIGSWWFLKKKTIWLKKAFIYRVLKNVKRRESTRTHQNQSKPTRNTPGIHHCVEIVFSLKTDRIKKVVTPKKETSEFFGNNWFTCTWQANLFVVLQLYNIIADFITPIVFVFFFFLIIFFISLIKQSITGSSHQEEFRFLDLLLISNTRK